MIKKESVCRKWEFKLHPDFEPSALSQLTSCNVAAICSFSRVPLFHSAATHCGTARSVRLLFGVTILRILAFAAFLKSSWATSLWCLGMWWDVWFHLHINHGPMIGMHSKYFFLPKLWTQKYIACPFPWISIKESRRVRTRFFLDTLPSDDPRAGASSWDSWFSSSSSLSLVGSCLTSGPNAKASCTERSLTDTLDTRSPASNNHGTIPIVIVIWDRCFHLSIVHSA